MANFNLKRYIAFFLAFNLAACVKELELPNFEPTESFVINAFVSNNEDSRVYFGSTKSFNDNSNDDSFDSLKIFAVSNLTDTVFFDYADSVYLASSSFSPGSEVNMYIVGNNFKDQYKLSQPYCLKY